MAGEMNTKAAAAAMGPVKRAYVTFLAGDDKELQAVVQLAEDLRKVGAAYPLVVAVLPDAPESRRRILVSHGCVVREVKPVVYPPEFFAMPAPSRNFVNYCSKLRVWEFVEYERMVYLDAGIQVLENIDELFDLERGHFNYATEVGIMFAHEPSSATAQALLDTLRARDAPFESFFLEDDFMNMFFRDLYKPIPLDHKLVQPKLLGHTAEDVQLDEAKRRAWGGAILGSWFTTKAKVLYRQNLPATAALAANTAAMGVINNDAANPTICFCCYTVFIAAIAAVTISLRRI